MFNYCVHRARSLIAPLAAALPLLAAFPAGAAIVAGTVELAEGEVQVLRESQSLAPKVGDVIHQGDTVVTAKDGELHLRMEDQGFLALRPNTRMKIEAYRAKGDRDDKSVLFLFTGTLRSITGWIGKNVPRNYRIRTATAALGIRGTDHEPLYIPEDPRGAEGEPGTYDKVNEGETFIQNPRGRVFVKPNQSAFVPFHARVAPKLLPKIPAFFRPTRNEAAIEKRRDTLKQEIDKRLKERRKEIKEKKKVEREQALAEKRKGQEDRRKNLKSRPEERQRQLEERRLQREDKKRELEERRQEQKERKKTLEKRQDQREAERDDPRERQENPEKRRPSREIGQSDDRGESERREAAAEKRRQAKERRDRDGDQEDRGRRRREQ